MQRKDNKGQDMDCKDLNHNVGVCECCSQYVAYPEKFGCAPVGEYWFAKDSPCNFEKTLDSLIDFVIEDAFEGLSDTDPHSVEKSIRKWFKTYQPERLSEKTYYRNEDGTYPLLEPVIGSDSLTS
jgi:hypothetical protein